MRIAPRTDQRETRDPNGVQTRAGQREKGASYQEISLTSIRSNDAVQRDGTEGQCRERRQKRSRKTGSVIT